MAEKLHKVVLLAMLVQDERRCLRWEFCAFDEGLFPPSKTSGDDDDLVLVSGTDGRPYPFVAKHFSVLDHCHSYTAYMAHKSCVYYGGGGNLRCSGCCEDNSNHDTVENECARSVFCMDTCKGSEWRRLPLMRYGRWVPQLHVLGGALYAIGGMREEQAAFMEMLPECADEWISLPDPPCPVKSDYHKLTAIPVEADGKEKESYFLFGVLSRPDVLYMYTPKSNLWSVVDSSSKPALVPHTFELDSRFVYLYMRNLVWYNIRLGQYHVVDLAREGMIPPGAPFPEGVAVGALKLFHVGGSEFGLIWPDGRDRGNGSDGYWCSRFTFDFKRALAGHKCCTMLWHSRCIGPQGPFQAALAVDVPAGFRKGKHYNEFHFVSTQKQVLEGRDGGATLQGRTRSKLFSGRRNKA